MNRLKELRANQKKTQQDMSESFFEYESPRVSENREW